MFGISRFWYPSVFVTVGLFLTFGLSACFRPGYYGDNVNGRSVERTIDSSIIPLLRSNDPKLTIQPSRCPDRIDVSHGKTASCTLVVNDVPLPVRVIYGGPPQQYRVSLPGSFFETRSIERFIEAHLTSYGVTAIARCPGPAVSVIAPGTTFTCKLDGSAGPKSIQARVGDNGLLTLTNPAGLHSNQLERALTEVSRRHRSGARVVVAGSLLSSFIDNAISKELATYWGPRRDVGKARCPSSVNLTGTKRALCFGSVDGHDVRYAVWIDESGSFHYQRLDAIISMALLKEETEKNLNQSLEEHGFSTVVKVDCGTGVVVVPAPSHFFCKLMLGTKPARLLVEVENYPVRWRSNPLLDMGPSYHHR